jgi:uncharacterized membrane protein
MLISFLPALLACAPPIGALATGELRNGFSEEVVMRSVDSQAYWQGVSIWLTVAATLAILAALYWRSRWARLKTQQPKSAKC